MSQSLRKLGNPTVGPWTPCNFLSSQDGKVNTSKILFALAIESNLVEERLGKNDDGVDQENNIKGVLFNYYCLSVYFFVVCLV